MARPIVAFLGPSLAVTGAARILPAIYRPPAEQGDVVRAVREFEPRAVALIDGVFASAPAVRHKEILWAMARGVRVLGAASMGALRAAELHSFGMEGVGLIYRWYRATPLADDEEVAVAMTPREIGAEALSEALINMRLTLRLAERRGVIGRTERLGLLRLARAIHFTERSYPALFERARKARVPCSLDRLEEWVAANAVDQKRRDAIALLERLAHGDGSAPIAPPFRMTEAWAADLHAAGLSASEVGRQRAVGSRQ